jgi:hypothetical protein
MLKVSITDGTNTYEVIFTKNNVTIIKSDLIIAEISLTSAAAAIVSQYIYDNCTDTQVYEREH